MTEKYNVKIKGTRPLLINSCKNILEENKDIPSRGKEKLTAKEQAERLLYKDKEENVVVPSLNLLACLRDSAVNFKVPGRGKKTYKSFIYSGLLIEPENILIISDDGWEVDLRPVVIGKARIIRARPKFINWELEFQVEIIDPIITPSAIESILRDAGKYNGLLDFRPLFGLFEVTGFNRNGTK